MNNSMLSDRIEKFILEMLGKQSTDEILLKRKDVADLLECAPSQVTYVINTRFSPDNRFVVESRRGSGGYIKISLREDNAPSHSKDQASSKIRSSTSTGGNNEPMKFIPINEIHPNSITEIENGLDSYFRMLLDYEIISSREYRLICTLTHTMLEYCPESHRREAAKTMIHRIEWVTKGE